MQGFITFNKIIRYRGAIAEIRTIISFLLVSKSKKEALGVLAQDPYRHFSLLLQSSEHKITPQGQHFSDPHHSFAEKLLRSICRANQQPSAGKWNDELQVHLTKLAHTDSRIVLVEGIVFFQRLLRQRKALLNAILYLHTLKNSVLISPFSLELVNLRNGLGRELGQQQKNMSPVTFIFT